MCAEQSSNMSKCPKGRQGMPSVHELYNAQRKQQTESSNRLHRNVRHLKNKSSRRMQRCCRSSLDSCLPFRHTAHIWGEQLLRQKPLASLYRKQFQALQH